MFPQAALVGLALVTLGQAAGIPDPTYPATGPPWNPPNIVPSAVNQVCRPPSGSSQPGAGTARFVHKPGGKTGSGIIITLGDCPPVNNAVKRSQEELARDVQFYEQFLSDAPEFDVAAALGLDPAHKLAPRNAKPEYAAPWRPTDLEPPSMQHDKRQACTYPQNDCRFWPGGAGLQGYSRCTFNCQAICVIEGGGPKSEDCQHIFDNFRTSPLHSNEHVAFSIPQDKFVMYSYGTCATTIHNHIPKAHLNSPECRADLIFSYANWAASGDSLVVSCREKAQNGICRDNTPGGVDFYMQMYRFEQV